MGGGEANNEIPPSKQRSVPPAESLRWRGAKRAEEGQAMIDEPSDFTIHSAQQVILVVVSRNVGTTCRNDKSDVGANKNNNTADNKKKNFQASTASLSYIYCTSSALLISPTTVCGAAQGGSSSM